MAVAYKAHPKDNQSKKRIGIVRRAIVQAAQEESVAASVVIADLSPSIGTLNQNVIMWSDLLLVPCHTDAFSARALRGVANRLVSWNKTLNETKFRHGLDDSAQFRLRFGDRQGQKRKELGVKLGGVIVTRCPSIPDSEVVYVQQSDLGNPFQYRMAVSTAGAGCSAGPAAARTPRRAHANLPVPSRRLTRPVPARPPPSSRTR